ncbi:DUF805 domain-containing protein [Hyphobacterium sp.]|jgi:uncharacterized membrane protein YhaH (DUF805 family)|uniref:DUF805 domain-containing protein n=1 Tax=Hyphobacterium sp. TaxID=2004662 RepID=UPI003BABC9C6
MDTARLQNLLLTFEGRIGPMSLMQGTLIIFIVNAILQLLTLAIPFIGILALALLYPMFCIYAKRFHDGGKPAIWTLAVLGGMIVANLVLAALMLPFLMGSAMSASANGMATSVTFTSVLAGIIIAAIVQFGAAFIVNQVVKSDPAPNSYGAPVADAASINPLN